MTQLPGAAGAPAAGGVTAEPERAPAAVACRRRPMGFKLLMQHGAVALSVAGWQAIV